MSLENRYRDSSYSCFHIGFPSPNYLITDFIKVLYCFAFFFVCVRISVEIKKLKFLVMLRRDRGLIHQGLLTVATNRCLGKENKKYSSDRKILPFRFWYTELQRCYRTGFDIFFPLPGLSGFNKEAEGYLGMCSKMMSIFLLIHPSLWTTSCH